MSQPHDPEEREAEQAAAAVARDPEAAAVMAAAELRAQGGARPLPDGARAYFERRFGHPLAGVRLHSDARADAAARSVRADAFTVGQDISFSAAAHAPGRGPSGRLLAHELTHVVQQARRGGGDRVVHRQPEDQPRTGPAVEELPQPPICVIIFDGDKFGPKLQCKNVPGLGSTPPVPLDPRQIPDYVKDKLGGLVPKTPEKPGGPGGLPGPGSPTGPIQIPLPPDITQKFCQDFPKLCAPPPQTTLGPALPFRQLKVLFRRDRPKPDDALDVSLAAGRTTLDDAISTLKSDVLVTAVLIGNASSEGTPANNFALADRRVAAVYREIEAAEVSWRVFDPELSFDDLDGCNKLGLGRWSCGEEKASKERVEPEDRNVLIALYRRMVFEPLPPFSPPFTPKPGLGGLFGPF